MAKDVIVIIRHSSRTFVGRSETCELTLTQVHPGITVEQVREATGWPLRVAGEVEQTEPPSEEELRVLRELRSTLEVAA